MNIHAKMIQIQTLIETEIKTHYLCMPNRNESDGVYKCIIVHFMCMCMCMSIYMCMCMCMCMCMYGYGYVCVLEDSKLSFHINSVVFN